MIKLSEKAKIILAVMAVVVVAAGAVTVTALSVNANDVQGNLSAGQGDGVGALSDVGVTITADPSNGEEYDGRIWSTNIDTAPVIGRYDYDIGLSSGKPVYSVLSPERGTEIIFKSIVGETFSNNPITENATLMSGDIEVFPEDKITDEITISMTQAGKYTINLTVNGNNISLYAQVGKKQLTPSVKFSNIDSAMDTYTGDNVFMAVMDNVTTSLPMDTVLNIDGISVSHTYIGETSPSGQNIERDESFSFENLQFDVVESGEYSVSLEILEQAWDNYEWSNSDTRFTTGTGVLKQVLVAPSGSGTSVADSESVNSHTSSIDFSSSLTVERLIDKISFTPSTASNNNQTNKYKVEYKLYNAQIYDDAHLVTALSAGQTVYAKAVNLLPVSDGDTTYRNYRLPEQGEAGFDSITHTIVIAAPALPRVNVTLYYYNGYNGLGEFNGLGEDVFPGDDTRPTLGETDKTLIYATYLNYGYKISQWLYDSPDNRNVYNYWELPVEQDGHEQGAYWVVTVNGETVNPDTYEMKDAGTYNIVIKPVDGYRFREGSEYRYTFIIKPFTIESSYINWIDNKDRIYTGGGIPFGENDYSLDLPALLSADNGNLTLDFERYETIDGVAIVINEDPVAAGSYNYRAKSINGENKKNYVLAENVNNLGYLYKIYRQTLPDFSGTPLAKFKTDGTPWAFNGSQQTINLDSYLIAKSLAEYRTDNDGDEIFVPFMNHVQSSPIVRSLNGNTYQNDASIELDQFFHFTYAGSYNVVFSLTTSFAYNYCWAGGDTEPGGENPLYTWENCIVVEQAEIDPTLPNVNISVNDEYYDLAETFAGTVNGGTEIMYELRYGRQGNSATSLTPLDKTADGKYIEGEYFVLIVIKDAVYPNCIFKTPQNGEYTVSDDGKQARMEYVVSSNTVSISVAVNNYVFGDNIIAGGKGIADVFTVTCNPVDGVTYGDKEFAFYTDEQCTSPVAESELINGLPRNAGTYYVIVTVNYTVTGDSGTESLKYTSPRHYELTVAKRDITLEWTLDGTKTTDSSASFTYNKVTHTVAVSAQVPNGLPAVNVALNGEPAINAGTHTYSVTGLSGDEKDNYAISGTNTTFTLTIDRAEITVTANDFANVTLGEAFTLVGNEYTVNGTFFNNEHSGKLSVAAYTSVGGRLSLVDPSNYSSLSRGQYFVVPVWQGENVPDSLTDNKYAVTLDNYVVTMAADAFSVIAQTLEITLYGGSSSAYGEDVDLYVPYVNGKGIYSLNIGLTAEQLKAIVTISLTTASGTPVSPNADGKINAGEYRLKAELIDADGDYALSVKYAGASTTFASYTVTRIEVTIQAKDVLNHRFGRSYSRDYNGYTPAGVLDSSIDVKYGTYRYTLGSSLQSIYPQAEPVGEYLHFVIVGNVYPSGASGSHPIELNEEGRYYYVAEVGNYKITSVAGRFVIKPIALTVTFKTGSSTYGDTIDLWKQRDDLTDDAACRIFDYFEATGLRTTPRDNFKDVVTVCLVDDSGVEYDPSKVRVGANTYKIKIKLNEGADYVLSDGSEDVNELVGGQFTVSPKSITVVTTSSKSGSVYGDGLAGITLDFTVDGLINGETKDGLNLSVGIYNGDEKIQNVAAQRVGNYVVGLDSSNLNPNYVIANNGVTKASFAITKRTVTLTLTVNGASSQYGETLSADVLYGEAIGVLTNLVNGHTYKNAVTLTAVKNSVSVTETNAPVGEYTVNAALNAEYQVNYILKTEGVGKYTVTQRKVVLRPTAVTGHPYGTDFVAPNPLYTVTEGSFVDSAHETAMQIKAVVVDKDGLDVTSSVASQAAGDYTIKLVITNVNGNYDVDVTTNTATFTIAKRQATVTFKNNASSVYGETVSLENLLKNNVVCSIEGLLSGDSVTLKVERNDVSVDQTKAPVGEYTVTLTFSASYDVTYTNGTSGVYNVTKRVVRVQGTTVNHTYGDELGSKLGNAYKIADDSPYQPLTGDNLDIVVKVFDGENEVTNFKTLGVKAQGYITKLSQGASANANYDVQVVNGAFVVAPREVILTFVNPANYHTVFFADDKDSDIVDRTLYSSAVVTVSGLVNDDELRGVISLAAVNGTDNATDRHAPAGSYTITPTVINENYVLKDSSVRGVYVIGKAGLVNDGTSGMIIMGTLGYTGLPQSVCDKPIVYKSVDGSAVEVLYKVVSAQPDKLDESFFESGASTVMPTIKDVSNNYVAVCARAANHRPAIMGGTFNIAPVTFTVTANDLTFTYHDSFPQTGALTSSQYTYTESVTATGAAPYAGLDAAVRKTYLDKLTYTTTYTPTTNAGATGIEITPVYDGGNSSGDNNVTVKCVAGSVTVNKADITVNSVTSGYNGVYTGSAYSLFKNMSADTVDGSAVTWYYRVVGGTQWTAYSNQTATNVCNVNYEVKAVDANGNHNEKEYGSVINFAITKNAITIKADDKTIVYGDSLSSVEFGGILQGSANGLIDSEVKKYENAVTYSVTGYAVTMNAGSRFDIVSNYTGDENVQVTVVNGTLNVSKRAIEIRYINDKSSVYGENVAANENLYSIISGELKNGDEFTVTVKNGEGIAASETAPAGSYVVTVTASGNYAVTYSDGENGSYTIKKRPVTVSLENDSVVYAEEETDGVINYNGGGYGKTQNAVVLFANTAETFEEGRHYNVSYTLDSESATPNKAGVYRVEVELLDGNYELAGDDTFSYEITRKQLASSTFMWEDSTLSTNGNNEGAFDNGVKSYVSDILQIRKFTVKEGSANAVDVLQGEEDNTYYYADGQLRIRIKVENTQESLIYTLLFGLNSDAERNYEITGNEVQNGQVERSFSVSSQVVTAILTQQNWQFSDGKKAPNTVTQIGDSKYEPSNPENVIIRYAPVTADDETAKKFVGGNGYDFDEVKDLFADGTLIEAFGNFEVGYYIVCVTYSGIVKDAEGNSEYVAIRRFAVFEVTKKELPTPSFENVKFNGQERNLTVNYDNDVNGVPLNEIVTAVYKGNIINNGDVICETNVGQYTILFSIDEKLSDKYTWKLDSYDADKSVVWSIKIDDDANTEDNKYFEVDDIAYTYGDTVELTSPAILKAGYAGTFTWEYASKRNDVDPSLLQNWSSQKPNYAGDFWVRVTLSDGNKNYTDKVDYASFSIEKAELTLKANGTITYGDSFDPNNGENKYAYVLTGFVNRENDSVVSGKVTYALVGGIDGTKLAASSAGYDLTVETENGFVKGLSARNYNIKAESGKLVVDKREVLVTISSVLNRQYGWAIDLSGVKATSEDPFAQAEVLAGVVDIDNLSTTATVSSPVSATENSYVITSSYKNDNFVIRYVEGNYQIIQRKVTVALVNGGGTYGKTITEATYSATVVDEQGVTSNLETGEGFVINVLYGGSATVPSDAGSYSVTVSSEGNANYVLANAPTLTFTVEKFAVDSRKIATQSKVYTGVAIKPDVILSQDADFTAEVFEVTSGYQDFIDASDSYKVTLTLKHPENYKWINAEGDEIEGADVQINFTIEAAGIFAIPYGNVTYGTAATDNTVQWRFVFAEDVSREVPEGVVRLDGNSIQIIFVSTINRDKPTAKTYDITFGTDESGRVTGFVSDNYNVSLQTDSNGEVVYGKYVVAKKDIVIVADGSSSVYTQNPADYLLNTFTLKKGESLAWDEELNNVIYDYVPSTTATASSNAGRYAVTAAAKADNYNVTVEDGVHEILPIEVKITLTANDGRFHGNNASYEVASRIATNLNGYRFDSAFDEMLVYRITGSQNNGNKYESLTGVIPKDAGSYEVSVSINDVDGNFVIDVVETAAFNVAKMVIDEDAITVESKQYNGKEQSHGLTNGDGYTVSAETFKNAGGHDVTLTLVNTHNYAWAKEQDSVVTKTFVITKATLRLQPGGTITYGDSFEASMSNYGFELFDLVGDDQGKNNDEIVTGRVKYLLANGIDGTKLNVKDGGYVMIADVSELSSENYDIEAIDGVLTVNKRQISVRPVASGSVYGEPINLSQDFEIVGSLADGDEKSVISYLAATEATSASDAGEYGITIVNAENPNYEITKLAGVYTVSKAKIGVKIRALNVTYGEDVYPIEFMSVVLIHSDKTTEPISHLQFVINFVGDANDGTIYEGREAPVKAGVYTATVTEVLSKNYKLDESYGISETVFGISKRLIDADKITAKSASYTGKAIIPEIEDNLYNINGETIYNTVIEGSLINVGAHDVTLRLVDVYNYAWVGNLNRTTTIKFVIVKADNSLVDVNNPSAPADSIKIEISDWTFGGEANKPKVSVISGEQNIVFEYSTRENGDYTIEVPQNAGEYWVRATVAASDNYNAFVSAATKFVIAKKTVSLPVATNLNENKVYTGSMLSLIIDGFDDQIMSLKLDDGMYRSDVNGKLNLLALNADTYSAEFKLRDAGNYVWENTASLEDGAVVVNWTVERQVIQRLPDAANKILVNGEDIVFIPEGFNSGIMTIEGNVRAHEGSYSAVVTLKDTQNYVWEGTDSPSITVVFELTGTNTAFIAVICVVSGLCVGLAAMALILTLVNRRKKRKEAEAIDARSRADGWEDK